MLCQLTLLLTPKEWSGVEIISKDVTNFITEYSVLILRHILILFFIEVSKIHQDFLPLMDLFIRLFPFVDKICLTVQLLSLRISQFSMKSTYLHHCTYALKHSCTALYNKLRSHFALLCTLASA